MWVVKDIIDNTKYDINSLQVIKTSHQAITKITDNKVEFIFEDINLPFQDAFNDGFVVFKIKTNPTLSIGTSVSNTASIYFDYNYPINTNTETSTFQTLSNTPFLKNDNKLQVFPNPSNSFINFKIKDNLMIQRLTIYDKLGKIILTDITSNFGYNIENLKSGVYIIEVTTEVGKLYNKFIKE
jgi:hypothetical protein